MKNKLTKGIFLGGIIGIFTALTIAPQSGKNTRNKLKNFFSTIEKKTKQTYNLANKKFKKFKVENQETLAKIKVKFNKSADKIKKTIFKKDDPKSKFEDIKE